MFTPQDADHLVKAVVSDLSSKCQHVANIVLGPQREGWFNAELFVTACNAGPAFPSGQLLFYGEQNFNTIRRVMGAAPLTLPNSRRMPDLVGHSAFNSEPYAMVAEQKVVYSDDPTLGIGSLKDLESQLRNAVAQLGVPAVGIVYMIKAPGTWGGNYPGVSPNGFFADLEDQIDVVFPSPTHSWIRRPSTNALPMINQVNTSTAGWSALFSVDVAAILLMPVLHTAI